MRTIWIMTAAATATLGAASATAQQTTSGGSAPAVAQASLSTTVMTPINMAIPSNVAGPEVMVEAMNPVHPTPPRLRPQQSDIAQEVEIAAAARHAAPRPRLRPRRAATPAVSEGRRVERSVAPSTLMSTLASTPLETPLSISMEAEQAPVVAAPAAREIDASEPVFFSEDTGSSVDIAADGITFTADLLKALGAGGAQTVMASPESLRAAMGLAALGAPPEITANAPLLSRLPPNTPEITAANAIWASTDSGLDAEFVDQAQRLWRAKASTVDFNTPAALETINRWINDWTDGLISRLVDALPPQTDLVLTNALAFQADWRAPFSPSTTRPGVFHLASGDVVEAQFMTGSREFPAERRDGSTVVRLDFKRRGVYMLAMLPDQAQDPDASIDRLTRAAEGFRPEAMASVRVALPKFDLSAGGDMRPALLKIGLAELLNARLIRAAASGPRISGVVQKVRVMVDEQGATAAAATGVFATRSLRIQQPPLVRFDRSFYFMILQDGAPAPLFAGYVASPL